MKNLIRLSTLAIAIAAIGVPSIPSVAQAQEVQYDPSAPRISDVEAYNDDHYFNVYTGSHGPLSFITLTPPEGANIAPNDVKVTQGDREIDSIVYKDEGRFLIVFSEPVPPRTTLQIALDDAGINPAIGSNIVNYRVAGGHIGLNQTLPYGLARITLR
ncbi:DUF2808 domain-containing protein [Chlorogloeopsis fritschii PCC 9212]|uniref:DUF2808 domain-containing protein n=1 Tax=Chlorogloeopsis fritschii PCC 6912 TaxID=211165 RepID=A0A433N3Y6_CHLFR|nr:DUF2808 domain-containing protein [Chlorogloeopsis fritschii]RUR75963.1 hypothetical protein PCC6912_45350 [Chlorogloeopsis fritschii PCC 6912]